MIIIFAYHSIANSKYIYSIPPAIFELQIKYLLKKRFKIIDIFKLEEILKEGTFNKNDKFAVITFDDAIKDNYINAFPILNKLKIPATIFVPAGLIGKTLQSSGFSFDILDAEEIKEMRKSGIINFQSHALSHTILSCLNKTEIERELITAKNFKRYNWPSKIFNIS